MSSIFEFLALPLELRYEIYDLYYKDTTFPLVDACDMSYGLRSLLL